MFSSAEQYLKTIAAGEASCVVIDVDLGGSITGLDLGKAILSSRRPTPIVFITGTPDAATRERAFAMGCVACIAKPVSSESLIYAIGRSGASSS